MVPKLEIHKPSEYIFTMFLCVEKLIEENVFCALTMPVLLLVTLVLLWPI